MGSECGMYAGEQRFIVRFGGEILKKRQFRRTRRRWEDNIKTGLQQIVCGQTRFGSKQAQMDSPSEQDNEPLCSIKCQEWESSEVCLCILIVVSTYSYCCVYVFLLLYLCIYCCVYVFVLLSIYSYCCVYVFLLLCLRILIVVSMYSYCCVYVFLLLCLCILIVVVYVFLLLLSMYSYCCVYVFVLFCLCILIVVYVFLLFVHVFLSLPMYTYCRLGILRSGSPD